MARKANQNLSAFSLFRRGVCLVILIIWRTSSNAAVWLSPSFSTVLDWVLSFLEPPFVRSDGSEHHIKSLDLSTNLLFPLQMLSILFWLFRSAPCFGPQRSTENE